MSYFSLFAMKKDYFFLFVYQKNGEKSRIGMILETNS